MVEGVKINDENNIFSSEDLLGRVSNLFIGKERGIAKSEYETLELKTDFGVINDIHAIEGRHQVSILSKRSIDKFEANDLTLGTFEANIIIKDMDLFKFPVGTKIKFGDEVILEITQIGKKDVLIEDHYSTMYNEGIFAKVINGGSLKRSDIIEVILDRKK